ncbi:MAG: mycofactocin-associated electron transfer flavoprotein alpha subunit [Acidimicrobiales bacterium]
MSTGALAIVPVRDGILPLGGEETIAEGGGSALLVGTGVEAAARAMEVQPAGRLLGWEAGDYRPAAWAEALFDTIAPHPTVILPASPDGRDLAPHLAAVLRRPLLAGAIRVTIAARGVRVEVARRGGRISELYETPVPVVLTMQPGVRGVDPSVERREPPPALQLLDLPISPTSSSANPELVEIMAPDPATMDLAEAPRIVAGGQGLGSAELFARLDRIAGALGASLGATRVAADAGWVPFERQIGTTGVAVNPRLYVAFAISGAVQHTSGLGHPDHIISVNLDASCPMMTMADLAIVCDARALIDELAGRLLSSTDVET